MRGGYHNVNISNAFERVLGLRVWVLVTALLVLGGVTAVVAQTNTGGSGSGALAGTGVSGFADGPAATAQFYEGRWRLMGQAMCTLPTASTIGFVSLIRWVLCRR